MLDLLKKMNYKGQSPVIAFLPPGDFAERLAAALPEARVITSLETREKAAFILVFTTKQEQIDQFAPFAADLLEGDGMLWVAYPKGSSKRYKCDFNRDTGFQVLGRLGFEPVRQVAIDEDWSALRFRRAEFIKTMTRSFAMSETGRKKTGR